MFESICFRYPRLEEVCELKALTMDVSLLEFEQDELSETYRESCRRQVGHIGQKLRAINWGIAPLTDWKAALFKKPWSRWK